MIEATGIEKYYGTLHVLKGVSLRVSEAEVVAIVGASGAGKSTLLQILGTLDRPDAGALRIGGADVLRLRGNELARFRGRHIGFVFQAHHLLPEFTAAENVCLPALIAGEGMGPARQRAMELLALLGLESRATHRPQELSGGEQQRVAVARALINRPAVVLADEPSGNLDSAHADELHRLFFTLRDQLRQTFVIVTHNPLLAAMADRCIELKDGLTVTPNTPTP